MGGVLKATSRDYLNTMIVNFNALGVHVHVVCPCTCTYTALWFLSRYIGNQVTPPLIISQFRAAAIRWVLLGCYGGYIHWLCLQVDRCTLHVLCMCSHSYHLHVTGAKRNSVVASQFVTFSLYMISRMRLP